MGFWGCRSFENDAVFDELGAAGRRNIKLMGIRGGLTEDRLNKHLMCKLQPALMHEKEKAVQVALGSMPSLGKPICFLGIVIWGLRQGFCFQPLVLDAALAAGYVLLKDKEGLQRWKHSSARKKRIAKEICALTEKNSAVYRDQNYIQHISQKFQWEIDSRY